MYTTDISGFSEIDFEIDTCKDSFENKLDAIVFIGLPGSGKGTHAKMLAKNNPDKFYHVSTGDMFRELMKKDKEIDRIMRSPLLIPDSTTIEVFYTGIQELIANKSYNPKTQFLILDGIPRTVGQHEKLQDKINFKSIVHIWTPEYVAINRMMERKDRPENTTEAYAIKRIIEYRHKTEPVLNSYYTQPKLLHVSNHQSMHIAHKELVKGLEEKLEIKLNYEKKYKNPLLNFFYENF
jgi:adenylate kinase